MKNIISKLNKTNLLDDGSINKFIDYMFNVINDAEYGNKLSQANSNIKEIKTKIKNLKEIKSPILKELAKQFSKLDPSLVEDIDLFNSIANNILDNLSKNTVADVINYQVSFLLMELASLFCQTFYGCHVLSALVVG